MTIPAHGKYESKIKDLENNIRIMYADINKNRRDDITSSELILALYKIANEISINSQVIYDRS